MIKMIEKTVDKRMIDGRMIERKIIRENSVN